MKTYIEKYIQQVIKIFACNADKTPKTLNGFYNASCNPDVIKEQFNNFQNMDDMLIGLATGNINNLVIIDIDVGKPDDNRSRDEILEVLKEYGPIPDTYTVETPSGGWHLYYTVPFTKLSSKRRFFDSSLSVDIRANGGYVCAADGDKYIVFDDVDNKGIDDLKSRCAPLPNWIENYKKNNISSGYKDPAETLLPLEEIREIRSALSFLSSDDRDLWIRIGMCLKSTGSASAFGLWNEWSQKSEKYNPAEMEKRWQTLKPIDVTIATLFHEAKQAGWVTTYGDDESSFSQEHTQEENAKQARLDTVYDELDKIKNFKIETYPVGEVFAELNRCDIKAVGDKTISIGGENSSGKTSLALHLALDILRYTPAFSFLFFSIDDPEIISDKRLISQLIQKNIIEENEFETEGINHLLKKCVVGEYCPNEKIIVNKKEVSISEQIVNIAKRVKERTGTSKIVILIDYLQLVKPSSDRSEINETVKQIKSAQKKLTMAGGCVLILLTQLNRDRDSGISRYRETSEIENVSDICLDIRHNFIECKNPLTGKNIFKPEKDNPIRFVSIEKNKLKPAGQVFQTAINPDFTFKPLVDMNKAEDFVKTQKEKRSKSSQKQKKSWQGE